MHEGIVRSVCTFWTNIRYTLRLSYLTDVWLKPRNQTWNFQGIHVCALPLDHTIQYKPRKKNCMKIWIILQKWTYKHSQTRHFCSIPGSYNLFAFIQFNVLFLLFFFIGYRENKVDLALGVFTLRAWSLVVEPDLLKWGWQESLVSLLSRNMLVRFLKLFRWI